MVTISYQVSDPVGFHARPITRLMHEVTQFDAEIFVVYKGERANLRSIFSVLALSIPFNAQIEIIIAGDDEIKAKNSIENFLKTLG
ncbi:HPr family phosphocarrier protein [Fusibacter bizertensis]